ncbi:hypothetical protein GCM10009864_18700 [Streptomyces lunalinharesii]|uniref:Uncharacterized protein n=1 Tax=Streptomyces lunalinharesii TaxID=333384 RepID=A0ABN3RJB4_9ACTN
MALCAAPPEIGTEADPLLIPASGPLCPVCQSDMTYTETDENMVTWIVCQAPGCGARSC